MLKQKKLTDQEAHKLFAKFAAPVFRAAKTPPQQKGAQRLAQTLWQAFLTGPEIETSAFENLEKFFSLKTCWAGYSLLTQIVEIRAPM